MSPLERKYENDICIMLSWPEIAEMAQVGCARNIQALAGGWRPSKYTKDGWKDNIEGACGEKAVALWLQVPNWVAVIGNPVAPDVLTNEVRTNGSQRLDDLVLRPQDTPKKDRRFISVLAFPPRFYIVGWIVGADGMIGDPPKEGPREGAWWVKIGDLNPMNTLPDQPPGIKPEPLPRRPIIRPEVVTINPKARFQFRGVSVMDGARCPVCYQTGGKFERVTYSGGPLGGLAVHGDCLQLFFADCIDHHGNVT